MGATRQEQQQRFEDLDRQYQDLERERQDSWASRQRQDIENRRQDFEQEMERQTRRRSENFDEETAQFERSMMDRQIALLSTSSVWPSTKEFNNLDAKELGNSQRGQDPSEWSDSTEEQQQRFEDARAGSIRFPSAKDKEFWESRAAAYEDIEYQRARFRSRS